MDVETLISIVQTLNSLSPLGLAAGLSYIIYLLVARKGPMKKLTDNHLSGLPHIESALKEIAMTNRALSESSLRQENSLAIIRDNTTYLKARADADV